MDVGQFFSDPEGLVDTMKLLSV